MGYEGGMNLYGYTGNNPVNRIDPSGLDGATATIGTGVIIVGNLPVIGVAVGIVSGVVTIGGIILGGGLIFGGDSGPYHRHIPQLLCRQVGLWIVPPN